MIKIRTLEKYIIFFNLFSFDALLVGLLWQSLFASLLGVHLLLHERMSLAFALWSLYLLDHWIDTHPKLKITPSSLRHKAIKKLRPLFFILFVMSMTIEIYWIQKLSPTLIKEGLVLLGLTSLYFLTNFCFSKKGYSFLGKELSVAIIFTAGTLLAPLSKTSQAPLSYILFLFFSFSYLAFLNLKIMNRLEIKNSYQKENFLRHSLLPSLKILYFLLPLLYLIIKGSSLSP